MKILALAGSNSETSINKKLLTHAVDYCKENTESAVFDLNDFLLPLYSPAIENTQGIPESAINFAQKIDEAEVVFIAMAEHNGNFSAAFKNLLDWTSRIKDRKLFNGKPVFLMATSPGARGGAGVLEIAEKRFPFDGAELIGSFSLPSFQNNFDENHGIIDEQKKQELYSKLDEIKNKYF